MKSALRIVLAFAVSSFSAFAQQTGVAAAWDAAKSVAEFSSHAARLKPLLDQMTPQQWVAQGASQTYMTQWEDTRRELEYLEAAARILQQQPDKLTAALDTYFRWQNLEYRMESLIEAVRKYQNPAVGDLVLGELRSNTANRDGLQQYITVLATQKEQEFKVADEEAQRCREDLLLRPPAPARRNTQK